MYSCPRCQTSLSPGVVRCSDCGADATLVARLFELPDQHFNAALGAVRRGDLHQANIFAGAVLAARMNDADGWLLMGHIQAALGNHDGARYAWKMFGFLRPGDSRTQQPLASLNQSAS